MEEEIQRLQNELKLLAERVMAVRITYEDITKDDLMNLFKEKVRIVVVGQEFTKKGDKHFHLFLADKILTIDGISTTIKDVYPLIKGNKHIMIKEARDVLQLLKYTVKESDVIYKGLSDRLVDLMKKMAYSKDKKAFVKLEEKYLSTNMRLEEYARLYIELKVQNNQGIYDAHVQAQIKKIGMKKGDIKIRDYVSKMFEKMEGYI